MLWHWDVILTLDVIVFFSKKFDNIIKMNIFQAFWYSDKSHVHSTKLLFFDEDSMFLPVLKMSIHNIYGNNRSFLNAT